LVALTAYDVDETGYWGRLRWVSGVYFGLAMAAVSLVLPNTRYSPPVTAAMSLAICGPLFGLAFPALVRRMTNLITAGIYAGESWIIDPPPVNYCVYYQIPCTRMNGSMGIGGVLYLGRKGLLFVPHKRNRKQSAPLEMGPLEVLKISRVPPFIGNRIQRLLIARPQEQIEVTWNGTTARFLMPNPADTFVKFSRSLVTLQQIPK
jgi:hypothetical protein